MKQQAGNSDSVTGVQDEKQRSDVLPAIITKASHDNDTGASRGLQDDKNDKGVDNSTGIQEPMDQIPRRAPRGSQPFVRRTTVEHDDDAQQSPFSPIPRDTFATTFSQDMPPLDNRGRVFPLPRDTLDSTASQDMPRRASQERAKIVAAVGGRALEEYQLGRYHTRHRKPPHPRAYHEPAPAFGTAMDYARSKAKTWTNPPGVKSKPVVVIKNYTEKPVAKAPKLYIPGHDTDSRGSDMEEEANVGSLVQRVCHIVNRLSG
jgi:hypothetical protein